MRTLVVSVLAISAAALLAAGIVLARKHSSPKLEVAALQAELQRQTNALVEAEARQKQTEQQREQIAKLADELGSRLVAQQTSSATGNARGRSGSDVSDGAESTSAGASATNEGAGFAKMLAKMMQDPDTKKLIRQQQRIMLDQLYAPLMSKLNLNETETAQLKQVLEDNVVKITEQSSEILGGPAKDRAERLRALGEERKQSENDIQALLGEDRYSVYKDYEKTVGERAQLNTFRQQTSGTPNSISDEQAEQLLAVIKEEKQGMPSFPGQEPGQEQAQMEVLKSPERLDAVLKAQETLNDRVQIRATQVLTPGQFQSFTNFQAQQLQTLRVSMSMARKMFSE
jgi:hypothetical protein